jgi:subtilisin family serine protease
MVLMDPNDDPDGGAGQASQPPLDPELARRAKVSPHLRVAAVHWEERRQERAGRAGALEKPPVVRVLIELKGPDTSELERTGLALTRLYDHVFSTDVPIDRLDEIAALESVLRIHHEEPTRPTLDDSIPDIRADRVRNPKFPFGGTNKYTGQGVIVGIIDSGINVLHPVFRLPNDQTKTRIRAILDQTQSPAVTYTRAQIEAAIAADTQVMQPGTGSLNDHTHGTHVAGIAAGNGKHAGACSGEYKYVGVAPDAELVIVKYDFTGSTSLLAAIRFIARTAAPLVTDTTPCVINMSFGASIGPHDGTDPLAKMVDDYLLVHPMLPGPPVVLVAAAGNEGGHASGGRPNPGEDTHAAGSILPGNVVKQLHYTVRPETTSTGRLNMQMDIRFVGANGLGCRLVPPGNDITGSNLAAPDAPTTTTFTENRQKSTCQIVPSPGPIPGAPAGSRRILIDVTSAAGKKNEPGEWVVELTNAGVTPILYHAWMMGSQLERFTDEVTRANTVMSPGSSINVITVGNHASSGKNEGKLDDSSGRGPLLDAATTQKPDLTAPGVDICSANGKHGVDCCNCCCDGYIDESGTSMSTPHVTGAIALMLERNPALTHAEIKSILTNSNNVRHDSFTGPNPTNDFGAGKLDVLGCLNDQRVRGTGPVLTSASATIGPRAVLPTAAAELPNLPQLQEGTPLSRLLNTAEGQRFYERGRTHWEEVRALVNTQKRIAVVWHRNKGPMLLHHITRSVMLPHVPLPREWDGVEISIRAARMVSALEPYASKPLIAAMHETLPLIAQLQGKTLLELVEMFESSEKSSDELQHA